jgi:hypothetical protein
MSLASRSANADRLEARLKEAAANLAPDGRESFAAALAGVLADLDHRLRVEVDEAIARLEERIDEELRDLAEAEQ